MTVLTELRHSGGYMVSKANGERSVDQVLLKQQTAGTVAQAGTVLGEILDGTSGTYAAAGGNTGTFTCSAVVIAQGIVEGVYEIEFIAATDFNVFLPDGALLAEGKTGVAFAHGGLSFTLTAGGTAAVAGDAATITIGANADVGKYQVLSLTAADGSQNAVAILYNTGEYSSADTKVTVTSRAAEVNGSELVYPAGANGGQIAAINAQLAAVGIIVR